MSQKEFARELNIGEATVSGIFTGRTKPTNAIVASIHARFPEVSIPWLMFGEGDMYVSSSEHIIEQPVASPVQGVFSDDLFSDATVSEEHPTFQLPQQPTPQPVVKETIKYIDKPQRKITEIRVFYDDGTYETFSPS